MQTVLCPPGCQNCHCCRHAHLQQELHKESVQLLHPLSSAAHLEASSGGPPSNSKSSSSTDSEDCDNTDVAEVHEGEQAGRGGGVTHVGLLRAGSARQVVAALADGQLLLYRENGKPSPNCICSCISACCASWRVTAAGTESAPECCNSQVAKLLSHRGSSDMQPSACFHSIH